MTLSFLCRASKAAKDGLSPIEFSLCINGQRKYVTTDRKIKASSFNLRTQKVCSALKDMSFMEKMKYKFVKHSFDNSWFEGLQECVENDGDTTKFDNDVVSVLKHTEEWHLLASEVIYGDAGIWVHNDDEFPFHFAVVKEGGEVVMECL